MATALEFYFGTEETQSDFTGAYATFLSVTVDRSGESGAKDFIILASLSLSVSDTNAHVQSQLRHDTTTLVEYRDTAEKADTHRYAASASAQTHHGHTYQFVKEVNLTAASHTIDIQVGRRTGSGNVEARTCTIIVLEKSANAQYAESTTPQSESGTTHVDALDLSFTSIGSTVDYVVIYAAQAQCADESISMLGIRFIRDDNDDDAPDSGKDFCVEGTGLHMFNTNDETIWSSGGAVRDNIVASTAVHYKIQIAGAAVNDEMRVNDRAIVAIPVTDFENDYGDSDTTKQFFTGTGFSDSTLDQTPTIAAAKHIVIAAAELSAETNISNPGMRLNIGGAARIEGRFFDDRDEDDSRFWCHFLLWAEDYASGSRNFKVQGSSSSGNSNNEGCFQNCALIILEIPVASGTAHDRTFAGALTFVGTQTKVGTFKRAFAGALTWVGNFARVSTLKRAFAGALSFIGDFLNPVTYRRALAGALTWIGTLSPSTIYNRAFAGSLSFVGGFTKLTTYRRAFAGALSWIGTLTKVGTYKRAFAGVLSFVGNLTTQLKRLRAFAGSLSFVGTFSSSSVYNRAFAGALSFVGGFTKVGTYKRAFAGALSWIGTLTKVGTYKRAFAGVLTWIGTFTKAVTYKRAFSGILTWIGTLIPVKSGGTAHDRTFAGALSFIGTEARSTTFRRAFVGALTWVGTQTKGAITFSRSFAGSLSFVGTLTKQLTRLRVFAGSLSFIGTLTKAVTYKRAFAGALSFIGTLTKAVMYKRAFAGVLSFVGTLTKVGTYKRAFAGVLTWIGTQSRSGSFKRAFSGVLSWIGTLIDDHTPGGVLTLTHGPVLGDVTPTGIKIWCRLSQPNKSFRIEYTKFADGFPGTVILTGDTVAANDNQFIQRITGLEANTRYSYKVQVESTIHGPFDFVTMPSSREQSVDIYVMGDLHPSTNPTSMAERDYNFQHILNKRNENPSTPAYGLFFGDIYFNDNPDTIEVWPTYMDLLPNMSTMLKYIPVDSMWDDHDFLGNNSYGLRTGTAVTRETQKAVYTAVTPMPDPDLDGGHGIQWSKVIGNALIIATDGRYNKEEVPGSIGNILPADPSNFDEPYQFLDAKTWGDEQLEWIKETILENQGVTDFLIIISSTTTVDNLSEASVLGPSARDSIGLYSKNERNSLLKWIDESSRFHEIIFLTGDDHKFLVWEKNWVQDPQYNTGDDTLVYPRPRHVFKNLHIHEIKQTVGAVNVALGSFFRGDVEFQSDGNKHGYTYMKITATIPRSYIDFDMYVKSTSEVLIDITKVFSKRIWSNPELIDTVDPVTSYVDLYP